MLICFGAAWPLSVYKSHRTKSNQGKSLAFLYIILAGYISGIIHKLYFNYDWVVYLYIFNTLFVMLDLILFYRNKKLLIL